MDFTLRTFRSFLHILQKAGYAFTTVEKAVRNHPECYVILRHDVDMSPGNSLVTAKIEASLGIYGTYYFRGHPDSFNEGIIQEISALGHEIGYHYEDLSAIHGGSKNRNVFQREGEEEIVREAMISFRNNLDRLRTLAPVKTISMHGSPLSSHDNRLLWKYFDYIDSGLIAEPYFDFNLEEMLYLSDTGRRWDGSSVSRRDRWLIRSPDFYKEWVRKPVTGSMMAMTGKGIELQKRHKFRSTEHISTAIAKRDFAPGIMITFHPQRWTDSLLLWTKELTSQRLKNTVKYFLNKSLK